MAGAVRFRRSFSLKTMTIIVSGTLHVEPGQREAYLAARLPIIAHAREAPGCMDFSLSADILDAGRINVYERWRSRDDLLAYRSGDGPELNDDIALTAATVELHHISASEAP
jgi:quinol monooxygenase YgiN